MLSKCYLAISRATSTTRCRNQDIDELFWGRPSRKNQAILFWRTLSLTVHKHNNWTFWRTKAKNILYGTKLRPPCHRHSGRSLKVKFLWFKREFQAHFLSEQTKSITWWEKSQVRNPSDFILLFGDTQPCSGSHSASENSLWGVPPPQD